MDEKIILLSEKISALVQEAETAGCAGNVEQVCKCACPTQQLLTSTISNNTNFLIKAQGLLKLSDQLRDERELLLRTANQINSGGAPPSLKDEYAAQQKESRLFMTDYVSLLIV